MPQRQQVRSHLMGFFLAPTSFLFAGKHPLGVRAKKSLFSPPFTTSAIAIQRISNEIMYDNAMLYICVFRIIFRASSKCLKNKYTIH